MLTVPEQDALAWYPGLRQALVVPETPSHPRKRHAAASRSTKHPIRREIYSNEVHPGKNTAHHLR